MIAGLTIAEVCLSTHCMHIKANNRETLDDDHPPPHP